MEETSLRLRCELADDLFCEGFVVDEEDSTEAKIGRAIGLLCEVVVVWVWI